MPEAAVNYLAVLVTALITMVIGFVWYSPMLFGKQWSELMGFSVNSPEDLKNMRQKAKPAYAVSFIGALLMSYVLAHFVDYAGSTTFAEGLQTGFWIWIGFVATTGLTNNMFSGKPLKLYMINYGYHLVTMAIAGGMLAIWT